MMINWSINILSDFFLKYVYGDCYEMAKISLYHSFNMFFVITNIYDDPSNIYHDESVEIAKAIVKGISVRITTNLNEREVKHN